MNDFSPLAIFCSQSCPGDIILKVQDWANARNAESAPVVGGFHTPVEREVLRILLREGAPVILVPARAVPVDNPAWRLPKEIGAAIRPAIEAGTARILSPFGDNQRRTTSKTAVIRNRYILSQCTTVLFAHASPGGKTEALAREAKEQGLAIQALASTANEHLISLGASAVSLDAE